MIIKTKLLYIEFNGLYTLKWFGTGTSILGAFILAYNLEYAIIGYVLFTIGSGAWFAVGLITKDKAMVALNTAFLVADFLGLWNNF